MERSGSGCIACLRHRSRRSSSALVVVAWRERRSSPFVTPTLSVIVLLFFVQLGLGAETVRLANTPLSVVLHWGTAMALIAALSAMAVFAAAEQTPHDARAASRAPSVLAIGLAVTAIATFVDDVHRCVRQLERRRAGLSFDSGMCR